MYNWKGGEPNDGPTGACIAVTTTGQWVDLGCEITPVCVMCEKILN